MTEFSFSSLADFIDLQVLNARERGAIREYDIAVVLAKRAVNSMSALDAFSMLPGSKPKPVDERPYRLFATIVYTKSGDKWSVANVKPTKMDRVDAASARAAARPDPAIAAAATAAAKAEAASRTGFGYRVKAADGVDVYDKPENGKLKGRLPRGFIVANAKGSFLGIPSSYQPEEKNGRTHV